jgi:Flp pilus assembly protein TadD
MGMRSWIRTWLPRRDTEPTTSGTVIASESASEEANAAAERLCLEAAQHLAGGRLVEAEGALARAIDHRHDHAEALLLQGVVYRKQGRLEDAADSSLLALHFRPDFAEAHFHLGLIAAAQGQAAEAERCYRRTVENDPGHARAQNALGAALAERGAEEEAVECFRKAVAADPAHAQAHSNLGCLLVTRFDRFDEGAVHIETAWRLAPEDRDVLCNWAMLLQYRGRLSESLALWDWLIENGANADDARLNRAMVLLKQADFARGWMDYEARKRVAKEYVPREFRFPAWEGEPLQDKTILVHAEQGLGDQIMFASCIPDLARLAQHCVLECAPKLEAICRRSFPTVTVVNAEEVAGGGQWMKKVPALDFHVAIGSLPQYFRRSFAEFPAHDGYLRADPDKTAAWRGRLACLPGALKVGISWRGGMKRTRQSVRSVPLDGWLPILGQEDRVFVSLQYTDCRAELAQLERDHGIRIVHWQEAIDDYDETAALVSALDLVISVQTALVHLGGALGRPVWVMVPEIAEWRYLQSGERMPWYPSVRVWRQERPGEWPSLIERVAGELRDAI